MSKPIRSILDALFHRHDAVVRFPRWLIPPFRFGYLVFQEFSRNRCLEKASALGFQTVFSMIPAFALALFFFKAFGPNLSNLGPQVQGVMLQWLGIDQVYALKPSSRPDQQPPGQETETFTPIELDTRIQTLIDNVFTELSSGGLNIVSFFWLIVAAMQLALTLDKSLNEIWGSMAQRRLVRRIALYWAVLTLGPVFIGLSIYLANQLGVNSALQTFAIRVAGPLIALYLIYQLMPGAAVHPLTAIIGAFIAAVLALLARYLFALYLEYAVGYGKLYGNLGLLPISLFWLWITWMIVLAGAEIAYTLQNLDRLTAEERRRRGAPFVHPAFVALGLVLHAGRAFQSGKGAVDADELAESSGLPDQLWMRLVNLLLERGILVEAGSDGSRFIPGRPLADLRVEEVFAAVEDSLVLQPDERDHPEQQQLRTMVDMLTAARQRELGQTSVADLLAVTSPAAPADRDHDGAPPRESKTAAPAAQSG